MLDLFEKCGDSLKQNDNLPDYRLKEKSFISAPCDFYTSYYSVENENRAIGISLGSCKFKTFKREYKILAPKYSFLKLDGDDYIKEYKKFLSTLDYKKVWEDLKNIANRDDVIICCYEKYNKLCHRHIVAEWLKENLNLKYKEKKVPNNMILNTKKYLYE